MTEGYISVNSYKIIALIHVKVCAKCLFSVVNILECFWVHKNMVLMGPNYCFECDKSTIFTLSHVHVYFALKSLPRLISDISFQWKSWKKIMILNCNLIKTYFSEKTGQEDELIMESSVFVKNDTISTWKKLYCKFFNFKTFTKW